MLIDFVVTHPLGLQYLNSFTRAGDAAMSKGIYKTKKHSQKALEHGYHFVDFAIETFGKMSQGAKSVLATLGDMGQDLYHGDDYNYNRAAFMDNARQLVSVALQNAISCQLHQAYMKRVGHTSAADSFEGVPDSIDALNTGSSTCGC